MEHYTNQRYTNIMRMPMSMEGSNKALYHYRKPTIQNCKVTFADGSTYWEKMFEGVKFKYAKVELNFIEEYLLGGINKGNYDWEIDVDSSVYQRIQVYKHPVPTISNAPIQVL